MLQECYSPTEQMLETLLYNLTCCACEDIALSDTELSQKATGSIHFLHICMTKGATISAKTNILNFSQLYANEL